MVRALLIAWLGTIGALCIEIDDRLDVITAEPIVYAVDASAYRSSIAEKVCVAAFSEAAVGDDLTTACQPLFISDSLAGVPDEITGERPDFETSNFFAIKTDAYAVTGFDGHDSWMYLIPLVIPRG
jgi:hypothetical protein